MNSGILAINGSHDASITCVDKNNQLRVFEYERYCRKRYGIFKQDYKDSFLGTNEQQRNNFIDYVKSQLKDEPETLLVSDLTPEDIELLKTKFPRVCPENIYYMGHHISHCAGAFYMSGFDEAISFSLDGGGMDYVSENEMKLISRDAYHCTDQNITRLTLDDSTNFNPGIYGTIGSFISELNEQNPCKPTIYDNETSFRNSLKCLSYAGKLMGLAGYGKIRSEWIKTLIEFYCNDPNEYWVSSKKILELKQQLNHPVNSYLSGQDSYDLAATNQYVFEKLSFKFIIPLIEKYNLNVVFSGGCALNVLFNQKLKTFLLKRGLKLFVPPFPSDCGLSFGHFTYYQKLKIKPNPYCGFDILDREKIPMYYELYRQKNKVKQYTPSNVVDLLLQGKIGAVIQGYSEIGPRALGNRSIICDPSFPDIKNILNAKVKFREWFRPFAPVCLEEDKDVYFNEAFSSEYMSYAPLVKHEWREKLISVTHVDNTARLQTVTSSQHKLFYDVLTEMKARNKPSVILNTSFNIKSRPILTTVEDAFYVLENTELDFLIVEDFLYEKIV